MNTTDRIADLSMLWKQASVTFPYFDQRDIDWDRTYREYLPKVFDATTNKDFHLLLAEFMNLLGDGHTDHLLPKSLQDEIGYCRVKQPTRLPIGCQNGQMKVQYCRGDYYV